VINLKTVSRGCGAAPGHLVCRTRTRRARFRTPLSIGRHTYRHRCWHEPLEYHSGCGRSSRAVVRAVCGHLSILHCRH
jgi:hypothetical protein